MDNQSPLLKEFSVKSDLNDFDISLSKQIEEFLRNKEINKEYLNNTDGNYEYLLGLYYYDIEKNII